MNFDEFIENIRRSFPEERIQKTKERLNKVWNLEIPKDRIPFVFSKIPDGSNVIDDRLYEAGYDFDDYLYYQLYQTQERSVLDDDYIPSFFPGCRQSAIPSAFGAFEEKLGEHFWSKPIIKKPEDVYKLGEPNFNRRGTAAWRILENIKYCRKKTKGHLPIHIADMQGPMACASTMWDVNDYLIAMYTNPEEVHYLHKALADAFIKFIDLQVEAAEGDIIPIHAMPFAWMPKEKGISLSNDLMALVTPNQLNDFSLLYDNRISNQYGGILIHSCGSFDHNLKVLKKVDKLRALNFGATETDIKDVISVFGDSILYVPHFTEAASPPMEVETQEIFIKRISKIIKESNVAAQVLILINPKYYLKEVLELNKLALTEFEYD
ncbi:MAG: hypothetical protein M1371_06370 [Actinobacteria bacterium]|nr:hypothetical protein [Actinomycetota bacterium]